MREKKCHHERKKKCHHERKKNVTMREKKTNSQLKTNLWEINKFSIENASGLELYSADYKQNSCCCKSVQL